MNNSEDVLKEITFTFIHSSGPGGQNVNKVATAVQLRFDVHNSTALDEATRSRLLKIAGKRATADGFIMIEAKRYRSQDKNKMDAQSRLLTLIDKAQTPPETRIPTQPTFSSKIARVEAKKRKGEKKLNRKGTTDWE
jgi:ribosome-associated protein